MVNDVFFDFEEEDYFKYIDNKYRVIEIRYFINVSADKDSGICYIFEKTSKK